MSHYMNWILIMIALALPGAARAANASEFNVTVEQNIDHEAGDATLYFDLVYNGDKPIPVKTSSIPGMQDTAIWIFAERFLDFYSKTHGDCPRLKEKIFIDDGRLGNTTIGPGQHIKQSIKLSDRYSNTAQVIGKCDVVVFWSYKPVPENGDAQRLSGAILLPAAQAKR